MCKRQVFCQVFCIGELCFHMCKRHNFSLQRFTPLYYAFRMCKRQRFCQQWFALVYFAFTMCKRHSFSIQCFAPVYYAFTMCKRSVFCQERFAWVCYISVLCLHNVQEPSFLPSVLHQCIYCVCFHNGKEAFFSANSVLHQGIVLLSHLLHVYMPSWQ